MSKQRSAMGRARVRRVRAEWASPASPHTEEPAFQPVGAEATRPMLASIFARRTKGQAIVIVAISLTVLILFVGLAIDVGNIMAKRAKLQSAVDASTLSAAQELPGGVTQTVRLKARQVLEANGVLSPTLTYTNVTFPGPGLVRLEARQRVETYFMRIIPIWQNVEISAGATADINSYAEIYYKPFGKPGTVTELNMQVWGRYSSRRGGDAYSPQYVGHGDPTTPNQWYGELPYGYLFRIDVPNSYIASNDSISVEIWDADTFNRLDSPPAWPTPSICGLLPCTPSPTPTPVPDNFARCADPNRPAPTPPVRDGCCGEWLCSSNNHSGQTFSTADPGTYINSFSNGTERRPAFWRADEYRVPYTQPIGGGNVTHATTTTFTLWHFDPRIHNAFEDPSKLSDQPSDKFLARWTIAGSPLTDLRWYRPSNGLGHPGTFDNSGTLTSFTIKLRGGGCTGYAGDDCYEREARGGMYFYLYVQGVGGSSENDYDLRVGPPGQANDCSNVNSRHCYINNQYYDWARSAWPDWQDGGARIFAKRALPLNLLTGASFPLAMTQVSNNAAGQALGVKHFDQDCGEPNQSCTETMNYQMQVCSAFCRNPSNFMNSSCWSYIATGYKGPNNHWVHNGVDMPERVQIPWEGTPEYTQFFGDTNYACQTSWLRIERNPSYSNDTTVWEMPFMRPRLVR